MARRKYNIEIIKRIVDGDNAFVQIGYEGPKIRHKEGTSWTDINNIKWKMENGVKIRINEQANLIREFTKRKCSVCGFNVGMLGNRLDEKFFSKTGMCCDCVQAEETRMVFDGTFKNYTEEKMLKNKLSVAKEFRKNVIETIDYLKKDNSKIEMVHANGDITTWTGSQNKKLLKEAELDLEKVNKLIEELEKEVTTKYGK